MNLTRREKRALTIAAVIAILITIGSLLAPSKEAFNQFLEGWELLYLFLVVAPLGFYVALDPERREGSNE